MTGHGPAIPGGLLTAVQSISPWISDGPGVKLRGAIGDGWPPIPGSGIPGGVLTAVPAGATLANLPVVGMRL